MGMCVRIRCVYVCEDQGCEDQGVGMCEDQSVGEDLGVGMCGVSIWVLMCMLVHVHM